uniref:Uncharacterized protein n=1 Tax=Romanomermis culicivorax TaxID=13658 RepID=A0A915I304_ROMCU
MRSDDEPPAPPKPPMLPLPPTIGRAGRHVNVVAAVHTVHMVGVHRLLSVLIVVAVNVRRTAGRRAAADRSVYGRCDVVATWEVKNLQQALIDDIKISRIMITEQKTYLQNSHLNTIPTEQAHSY